MLSYTFWHWRRGEIPEAEYEGRQVAFHDALAAVPPPGFIRSRTAAIIGRPWANQGGPAFEDWYLVTDAAALESLNDGAITASRKAPHDRAAEAAGGGTAGVYRLRLGEPLVAPAAQVWFAKPLGMSYPELDRQLGPLIESGGGALWMRYMVLGPTPELCLETSAPIVLPAGFSGQAGSLRAIWPRSI